MASGDKFYFTLVSKEFYESFEHHHPDLAYYRLIERILPPDWEIVRGTVWFHCHRKGTKLPEQGWKIHLSATFSNAPGVLTSAARVLMPRNIPFKFGLDRSILYLLNGKRWPRGGAGKFITVYPRNDDEFRSVIEELHQATIGYTAAYILSDKRYKNSSIVHYRYGGLLSTSVLDIKGERQFVVQAPDGTKVTDLRAPYFFVPEWTQDPFPSAAQEDAGELGTLKGGRYLTEEAVAFSNTGGVYLAQDRLTGKKVLIKEARPFTNISPNGTEAVTLLKKEHRLLTILKDTNISPQPIDFFKDWEHYYLVEEFVGGTMLRLHALHQDLALRTTATLSDVHDFFSKYCKLYRRIAEALATIHKHDIVFGDLSFNNILVDDDDETIRFIDFEAAHEIGVDWPSLVYTPGFASVDRVAGQDAEFGDDYFAFGGLLMSGLMPVNLLLNLDPTACDRFLRSLSRDLGLPDTIRQAVVNLTRPERIQRITPVEAMDLIESDHRLCAPCIGSEEATAGDCQSVITKAVEYTLQQATYDRTDRLFPSDARVFSTNGVGIAYGACGIAYAIQRITGSVPDKVLDWIVSKDYSAHLYPPGLYTGLSGVAWTLMELGLEKKAVEVMKTAQCHSLVHDSPDVFFGTAGWGMGQLKFFLATQDELYLDKAIEAGNFLVQSGQKESENSCCWPSMGLAHSGFAHGASGISLFLLYLYLITRDEHFLHTGERGLNWVISKGTTNSDGGLTWRLNEKSNTVTPYWRYGSVGIGGVLLRYWLETRNDEFRKVLEASIIDADRKYAIFPSLFFGLSGLGEFFLDLARYYSCSQAYLNSAWKVAAGVLLFKLQRKDGIAFPGEQLMRISCDYGTGIAGIILFLNRLLHDGQPAFMLDELLASHEMKAHVAQREVVQSAALV
jgi:serine/threonine protein kinase